MTPGDKYGYGTAALDFLQWEIKSGRLAARGGSPWWKRVNGMMVSDMRLAMEDVAQRKRPQTKAVAAWVQFAEASKRGKATQEMFWDAHQLSLHEGISLAAGVAPSLNTHEGQFDDLAVSLVDLAAIGNKPSNTREVEKVVFSGYGYYPASKARVQSLYQLKSLLQSTHQLPRVPEEAIGISPSAPIWQWAPAPWTQND